MISGRRFQRSWTKAIPQCTAMRQPLCHSFQLPQPSLIALLHGPRNAQFPRKSFPLLRLPLIRRALGLASQAKTGQGECRPLRTVTGLLQFGPRTAVQFPFRHSHLSSQGEEGVSRSHSGLFQRSHSIARFAFRSYFCLFRELDCGCIWRPPSAPAGRRGKRQAGTGPAM